MLRSLVLLAVLALTASACARGTPQNPILPAGATPTPIQQPAYVGIGKYQTLEKVTVAPRFGGISYIAFVEVRQPPGRTPHNDLPGFIYAYQGPTSVSRRDGELQQAVAANTAVWVDTDTEHVNGSTADAVWYFVSFRPIAQRGSPISFPNAKMLFATGDLASLPTDKNLVHELAYLTMDVGGRTSSHSHGGIEAFYVLKGTVELALNNGTRKNIAAGEGAAIVPGAIMQLHVVGNQPVQILSYFVTPEGLPWQTNLQTVP